MAAIKHSAKQLLNASRIKEVVSVSVYEKLFLGLHANLYEQHISYGVSPGKLPKKTKARFKHKLEQLSQDVLGPCNVSNFQPCQRPSTVSNMPYIEHITGSNDAEVIHVNGLSQSGITNGPSLALHLYHNYLQKILDRQQQNKSTQITIVGKGPVTQHLLFLFSHHKLNQHKDAVQQIDFNKVQFRLISNSNQKGSHDYAAKLIHPDLGFQPYPLSIPQSINLMTKQTALQLNLSSSCLNYGLGFLLFKLNKFQHPSFMNVRQYLSDTAEQQWLHFRRSCEAQQIDHGVNSNGFLSLAYTAKDKHFLDKTLASNPKYTALESADIATALGTDLIYPHGAYLSRGGAIHLKTYERAVQSFIHLSELPIDIIDAQVSDFKLSTNTVWIKLNDDELSSTKLLMMPGAYAKDFPKLRAPFKLYGLTADYDLF